MCRNTLISCCYYTQNTSPALKVCGIKKWRRNEPTLYQLLRSRLALLKTSRVNWNKVLSATKGLSHAELARACEHAAKDAILARRTTVETSELVAALMQRRSAQA